MAALGMGGDKSLKLSLSDTFRLAWTDEDLRPRIMFILLMFGLYALGVHVPVPIPGVDPSEMTKLLEGNSFLGLVNMFGGGAFKRLSVLALGLNPYITASIILQVLTFANPAWKQEMQEGGEYARRQQNRRTRLLTLALCVFQGLGLLTLLSQGIPAVNSMGILVRIATIVFWTAGAMFLLWMGEQLSEKGIGNGVSLLIFAGIVISLPNVVTSLYGAVQAGTVPMWQAAMVVVAFIAMTWFVVMFSIAQRRIPIQHMRRNYGTKTLGGQTSYLPISVNMAGVIPIIFAISLVYMPAQFMQAFPAGSPVHNVLSTITDFMSPNFASWKGYVGAAFYTFLIFIFCYLWNAMVFNVEDMSNQLKRHGSYIPGIRPGKQTTDFLNGVVSRVTFVGAVFLAVVALTPYMFSSIAAVSGLSLIAGTSLLIMVSVALETMRQIEANILAKQYGGGG
ncbi:MAG: preprotein translocase subunit SecY [Fimbriimonadaceae bacterium]|nr:preprotein translocase subunit SecY [Fimbriimonadaceae bacterium]